MRSGFLGWLGIMRLGLAQTALGAIMVLTTSTMNRIMVVELALPAILPGALVAWHYALQALRPRFGYGSDQVGRRTPWIIGGMAVLALGGLGAAFATALMAESAVSGIALAVAAFTLIGIGVGASGTSLLALMATHVRPEERAAAAMIMWMMMIVGIVVTTIAAGQHLDPYSPSRLVVVTGAVAALALIVTSLAVFGVERQVSDPTPDSPPARKAKPPFARALREVWDDHARGFTIFVFLSMLAYSAQDLILEPFAGSVFGLSPGASTKLAGVQHGGVFAGMLLAGLLGSGPFGRSLGSLRGGPSVAASPQRSLLERSLSRPLSAPPWPLRASVFALGAANGVFAVAAIGSMMKLAGEGQSSRKGTRIGLWGAAQAFAFGIGGFLGTAAVDLARVLLGVTEASYAIVFAAEGLLFLLSGMLAAQVGSACRLPHESRSWPAEHAA
jgi:BCD family chlorophyll transporter-like MFS transporter